MMLVLVCPGTAMPTEASELRIRDLGIAPGVMTPGTLNAITDVAGVRVGHRTLVSGESIRTGVTAILPHGGNLFTDKVPAAVYTGNGFGKAAGFEQVRELGELESPILLTNTLNVGTALAGGVKWLLGQAGNEDLRSVNVVVGETNDAYLNDIRGQHVSEEDVFRAIEDARGGPVMEGNVGAGTGTRAFGFKGGIGSASRVLPAALGGWTVGTLVQANFGGVLTIDGLKVGEALGQYDFRDELMQGENHTQADPEEGSIMVVIATDAPVGSRNLERMARRAPLGIARTGGYMSNGSGDFVIAFSVAERRKHADPEAVREQARLANRETSALFLAVVEAVEEAIHNALVAAETMTGVDGRTLEALPLDRLRTLAQP
ncbi:L-aminopeptidase DmpA [Chromatocurvus halotolerans]|uniref:L-aminopeptidase DmpA n=2 Tax=Chromatocurvus halotolerans TaxID=1132028 RepID=A0A4R2KX40_9GAMM|nr:L-aminopeptidase DmpA [Chromatocurvus halotolerans]